MFELVDLFHKAESRSEILLIRVYCKLMNRRVRINDQFTNCIKINTVLDAPAQEKYKSNRFRALKFIHAVFRLKVIP